MLVNVNLTLFYLYTPHVIFVIILYHTNKIMCVYFNFHVKAGLAIGREKSIRIARFNNNHN